MVSTLATCCPSAHDHSQTPCRQKVWLGHGEGGEVAKRGSAGRASPLAEWPPALRLFSHTTDQIAVLKNSVAIYCSPSSLQCAEQTCRLIEYV